MNTYTHTCIQSHSISSLQLAAKATASHCSNRDERHTYSVCALQCITPHTSPYVGTVAARLHALALYLCTSVFIRHGFELELEVI